MNDFASTPNLQRFFAAPLAESDPEIAAII